MTERLLSVPQPGDKRHKGWEQEREEIISPRKASGRGLPAILTARLKARDAPSVSSQPTLVGRLHEPETPSEMAVTDALRAALAANENSPVRRTELRASEQ